MGSAYTCAKRSMGSSAGSWFIRARSEAGLEHDTAVTLYRGSDRVDIRNEITANFADVRYWAFSVALADPAVHTEEVGAVILDRLRSAGGDYADTRPHRHEVAYSDVGPVVSIVAKPPAPRIEVPGSRIEVDVVLHAAQRSEGTLDRKANAERLLRRCFADASEKKCHEHS